MYPPDFFQRTRPLYIDLSTPDFTFVGLSLEVFDALRDSTRTKDSVKGLSGHGLEFLVNPVFPIAQDDTTPWNLSILQDGSTYGSVEYFRLIGVQDFEQDLG
jgi:hypothetical protein